MKCFSPVFASLFSATNAIIEVSALALSGYISTFGTAGFLPVSERKRDRKRSSPNPGQAGRDRFWVMRSCEVQKTTGARPANFHCVIQCLRRKYSLFYPPGYNLTRWLYANVTPTRVRLVARAIYRLERKFRSCSRDMEMRHMQIELAQESLSPDNPCYREASSAA